MAKVLVKTDKYNGRYVAMKSFDDHTIVGSGEDPETALREAAEKGCERGAGEGSRDNTVGILLGNG